MKYRVVLVLAASVALGACDRSKSVQPGDVPPGAGAGQRGGLNDGDAAGKVRAPPGDPAAAVDKKSSSTK